MIAGITNDISGKYLLVSDSNEVGYQFDSKKLQYSDLVEMAQDNLFKKNLDIIQLYLTTYQYDLLNRDLEDKYAAQHVDTLPEWSGKFKVVEGQVIFVKESELQQFNSYLSGRRSPTFTPTEYVRAYWDIPLGYHLVQIQDCMLRGVTEIKHPDIVGQYNTKVGLEEKNIPVHMHNSSITTGTSMQSVAGLGTSNKSTDSQLKFDMFYNDSIGTGLDNNELEGVVDEFTVQDAGTSDTSDGTAKIYHDNLPRYQRYHAFVVTKDG